MIFRDPTLLALVVLAPLGAWALYRHAARRRAEALELFGTEPDAGSLALVARARAVRAALVCGALASLALALAGPRFGQGLREIRQESLDLLVVLDVSNSMLAEDVAPNRLERAKLEVARVAEARRGDRLGLVAFAGDAFLQCPLTTDQATFRRFLDAASPELMAVQGTHFARALEVARRAFEGAAVAEEGRLRPRAVLVVSDGEDHEDGLAQAAARLQADGVAVLAIGVGTAAGAPVPDGRGGFRTFRGETVVSAYEPGTLRTLAGRTGVFHLDGRSGVADAVADALAGLDRALLGTARFADIAERFQWPLALAVLLLLAERVLALRPDLLARRPPRRPRATPAPVA